MKIEISIGHNRDVVIPDIDSNGHTWYTLDTIADYEHEGYYDSIEEAIEALQYLKMCEERGDFVE
jgi:hypothetical protein